MEWFKTLITPADKRKMSKDDFNNFIPEFVKQKSNDFEKGIEEIDNGLCFNNVYVPEEIVQLILSHVDPQELLDKSLVCRQWNRLIKSFSLWSNIYARKFNKKPKKLPWFVYYCLLSTNYFDTNLLKNGNGQEQFKYWEIKSDGGDKCKIESNPIGADALPLDVPEFYNSTSCFATSYSTCYKIQPVLFGNNALFKHVLNNYKPHIYLSEWTAGRFDCGSVYKLQCSFIVQDKEPDDFNQPYEIHRVEQWQGGAWQKIEIIVKEYPDDLLGIIFEHEGRDTQFWAGHYGSKMAGGVAKLLFDSIESLHSTQNAKASKVIQAPVAHHSKKKAALNNFNLLKKKS